MITRGQVAATPQAEVIAPAHAGQPCLPQENRRLSWRQLMLPFIYSMRSFLSNKAKLGCLDPIKSLHF